jgi:hypothetical protein
MSLIKFNRKEDFGTDYYVQVLNVKGWSLLQASFSINDFPGWPYIQIKSGSGSGLSILLWVHKLGFDLDLLSRTWRWND